ncbi:hypothetical protein FKM82_022843 [Ascaphus truei]
MDVCKHNTNGVSNFVASTFLKQVLVEYLRWEIAPLRSRSFSIIVQLLLDLCNKRVRTAQFFAVQGTSLRTVVCSCLCCLLN